MLHTIQKEHKIIEIILILDILSNILKNTQFTPKLHGFKEKYFILTAFYEDYIKRAIKGQMIN